MWTDDESIHFDNDTTTTVIPLSVFDQVAVMRHAQLVESGSLPEVVAIAVRDGGPSGGALRSQQGAVPVLPAGFPPPPPPP